MWTDCDSSRFRKKRQICKERGEVAGIVNYLFNEEAGFGFRFLMAPCTMIVAIRIRGQGVKYYLNYVQVIIAC